MSVEAERLYDGITGIRDDIVERAEGYVFRKKDKGYRGFAALGTMAACACLLVMVVLPNMVGDESCSENGAAFKEEAMVEDKAEAPAEMIPETAMTSCDSATQEEGLDVEGQMAGADSASRDEVQNVEGQTATGSSASQESSFGTDLMETEYALLLPGMIPEGYEPEDSAYVYENTVLQAKYYNEELQDELIIRIASREWFEEEYGELELYTVLYREKPETTGSYIFVEGDGLIAEYSFSSRNIAEMEDFYDMVYSATFFQE